MLVAGRRLYYRRGTMKYRLLVTLAAALAVPLVAGAANFNTTKPILCATHEAVVCVKTREVNHNCVSGVAGSLGVPQFVKVDFANKTVTATAESGSDKMSKIDNVSQANGHVVVQGIDDGHGWSLVLEENSGHMTASSIGDEEGLVVFGACTQI
jgi:hypothetical protein